jgi:co-chaperonin GroES (HSP10)
MQAINYFVVIRKIKEAPKKVGGLELTEDQNKDVRYLKAEVVSVGDKVQGVEPGNIIRYDRHAGHGIEWNDEFYHVINLGDVVIVE